MSYSVGALAYQFDLSVMMPNEKDALSPIGNFIFPKWVENSHAMFFGLFLGWVLGFFQPDFAKKMSQKLEAVTKKILQGILCLIPFFIAGFVVKMHHDQVMSYILAHYAVIFSLVAASLISYIAFLYFAVNGFQKHKSLESIKNILPAAIAGFGSMSSAAAMPLTLIGSSKNASDKEVAEAVIPATVNVHLIGDCFAIPIFAFAVLKSFGAAEPAFVSYLIFSGYFVLTKFSVAAIPGGGILVMLPILETYLGFTSEMLSLITALYILFDPVITGANVMGNGAFAMWMDKLVGCFRIIHTNE